MKAISLSNLFCQKIYRIPNYQRGYAWGQTASGALGGILEISEIKEGLRPHYTRNIYVEAAQPGESERWLTGLTFYNVVDGQQRLITILLQELLNYSGEGYYNETREDPDYKDQGPYPSKLRYRNILFSNPSIRSAISDGKKYEPPVRREDAIIKD